MAAETLSPSSLRVFGRELFEVALQIAVERQLDDLFRRMRGDLGLGQMRREHREMCSGRSGWRSALALSASAAVMTCAADGAAQNAVAGCQRGFGIAIEAAHFRRLRERDEQRRFAEREPPRLLAEVGKGRGPDAFEIAAERRQAKVEFQDLGFRERAFEFDGARHLAELAARRAFMLAVEQARDLHRQRRAAGDEAPVPQHLQDSADDGFRVDAVVAVEALVLEGEEHLEVVRVDVLRIERQSPFAFGRREGAKQAIVAIDDGDGRCLGFFERQRSGIGDGLDDRGRRRCLWR